MLKPPEVNLIQNCTFSPNQPFMKIQSFKTIETETVKYDESRELEEIRIIVDRYMGSGKQLIYADFNVEEARQIYVDLGDVLKAIEKNNMRWKQNNSCSRRFFAWDPVVTDDTHEKVWLEFVWWKCTTKNRHHKTGGLPCLFSSFYSTKEASEK